MTETGMPIWAQIGISLASPLGTIFAFIFGRASKAGGDSIKLNAVIELVNSLQSILNATVVTVSNHGQSLQMTDTRLSSLETEMKQANKGITQLLERTENMKDQMSSHRRNT